MKRIAGWIARDWKRSRPIAQIAGRLIFELGLPGLVVWLLMKATGEDFVLTTFMATYTGVGFVFMAFFRIRKQHQQETATDKMKEMLASIDAASLRLENASKSLLGHATGGGTTPLLVANPTPVGILLSLCAAGEFALQHVSGWVAETSLAQPGPKVAVLGGPVVLRFGPVDAIIPLVPFELGTLKKTDASAQRFYMHLQTRAGVWMYEFLCVWGEYPQVAMKFHGSEGPEVKYIIPPGFPGHDPANPEGLFRQ